MRVLCWENEMRGTSRKKRFFKKWTSIWVTALLCSTFIYKNCHYLPRVPTEGQKWSPRARKKKFNPQFYLLYTEAEPQRRAFSKQFIFVTGKRNDAKNDPANISCGMLQKIPWHGFFVCLFLRVCPRTPNSRTDGRTKKYSFSSSFFGPTKEADMA